MKPPAGRCLVPLMLVTLIGLLACRPLADPDVWFHLRMGQWILENGELPEAPPFAGVPRSSLSGVWFYNGWLSQMVFASLQSVADFRGLIMLSCLVLMATWAALHRTLRLTLPPGLAGSLVLLAALAGQNRWSCRPEIFSGLGLALLLLVLESPAAGRWSRAARLAPLFFCWVQLHGAFGLGYAVLLLYALAEALERRRLDGPDATALVGALAAGCLNPRGPAAFVGILSSQFGFEEILRTVNEWSSPRFGDEPFLEAWILLAILLFALARPRPPVRDLVLFLAGFHLVLGAVRHMVLFAIMTAPVLARSMARSLEDPPWPTRLESAARHALVVACLVMALGRIPAAVRTLAVTPVRWDLFPVAAVSFLSEAKLPGPMFNHYDWGYFLGWALFPGYRVFIDGTAEMYTPDHHRDYNRIVGLMPGWAELLEARAIQVIVLPNDCDLSRALLAHPRWALVHVDPRAVVFGRDDPANRDWLDRHRKPGRMTW